MAPIIEPSSTWSSNLKLNLAMLSYSTGLSIPRVASPLLLRTKVGILLLVPMQLLVMFTVTIPCLFMELALGQYSNKSAINVWDLCPLLRGIGICSFALFLLYQTYNFFLCTCTLSFAFLSWTSDPHQWKSCNRSWNRINCYTIRDNYTRRFECGQKYSWEKCDKMQWQSSVEQFYFYRMLNVDDDGYIGTPQTELLVHALIISSLVFFANYAGPRTTEKFLIVLTVVPMVQLIFLFFTPLTNSNVTVTLGYLFSHFDKARLSDFKVWSTVVELSLSTPGLGFGAYTTLGTHSSFRNPIHLKTVVLSLLTCFFTIVYTITLQNFLVSLCLQSKMLVGDFFNLEQELSMPDAVFFLEHSPRYWMVMWLSNSYMLGLRGLMVMMSINAEIVYSSFPRMRRRHNSCIFLFCILFYSGGIFLSTRVGYFVVKTIDQVMNRFVFVVLNAFNLVGVAYFYGIRKFKDDVYFMLGIRSSRWWNALYLLNPIFLVSLFVYNVCNFYTMGAETRFLWMHRVEIFLMWFTVGCVVLYAFFYMVVVVSRKDMRVFKSSGGWGPRYSTLDKSRRMFRAYNMAKEYLYRQERFRQFRETQV